MILEYHRPSKIEDVMSLLARMDPPTVLLGGGTTLERFSNQPVAVVDLQATGLNTVQRQGNMLEIGATLTLQKLADTLKIEKLENLADLGQAIAHEATYNLRQVGTVAGALVTANGRSPFAAAMLALDATLWLQPGDEQVCLGDLLPAAPRTSIPAPDHADHHPAECSPGLRVRRSHACRSPDRLRGGSCLAFRTDTRSVGRFWQPAGVGIRRNGSRRDRNRSQRGLQPGRR